jgi:hypothetical protein
LFNVKVDVVIIFVYQGGTDSSEFNEVESDANDGYHIVDGNGKAVEIDLAVRAGTRRGPACTKLPL